MRLISLSIIILAGAIMASAGTVADALPAARQYSQLPICGLLLVGIAGVMFVVEWWPAPARRAASHDPAASVSAV